MLTERHYAEMLDTLAEVIAAKVASRLAAQKQIRVLNLNEAASMIGRTVGAMRQLIARGEIPAVRSGRRVQVEISQLEAYIERNRTA